MLRWLIGGGREPQGLAEKAALQTIGEDQSQNPYTELLVLKGHHDIVRFLVQLDDHRFASAGDDGIIVVWNVQTGEKLLELRGHTQKLTAIIAFPPLDSCEEGSQLILTASADRTVCSLKWPYEVGVFAILTSEKVETEMVSNSPKAHGSLGLRYRQTNPESLLFAVYSKGISALVEIPRDCVVAAVGKELIIFRLLAPTEDLQEWDIVEVKRLLDHQDNILSLVNINGMTTWYFLRLEKKAQWSEGSWCKHEEISRTLRKAGRACNCTKGDGDGGEGSHWDLWAAILAKNQRVPDTSFATGSHVGELIIWDALDWTVQACERSFWNPSSQLDAQQEIKLCQKQNDISINHVTCDEENIFAAVGRGLYVYNLQLKRVIACQKTAHDSNILHIDKLPNRQLISCSEDGSVRIWEVREKQQLAAEPVPTGFFNMWGFGRVNKQTSQPVKKQQENGTTCSLELTGDLIGHSSSVEMFLYFEDHGLVTCSADHLIILWKNGERESGFRSIKLFQKLEEDGDLYPAV